MNKAAKRSLIVLGSIALIAVALVLLANYWVEKKIAEKMSALPDNISIAYDELDINLIAGSLDLKNPKVRLSGQTETEVNLKFHSDWLNVVGINYWDYMFNDAINIDSIAFRNYEAIYHHNKKIRHKEYKDKVSERLKKQYHVNAISFINGSLTIVDDMTDNLQVKTKDMHLVLKEVLLNNQTKDEKIPFRVADFSFKADSLFYRLSDFENLNVGSVESSLTHSSLKGIQLKTKYSKTELTQHITKERDYFDLKVSSVEINNQDFGYVNDSTPYFSATNIKISDPNFEIYRNKLVADDNSIKPLYSKMLRSLNLRLTLNEVSITNGLIDYSEKVKIDTPAAQIKFTDASINISKLSNTYPKGDKTQIHIESRLMGIAPLTADWSFDINNPSDQFVFSASVGKLPVDNLNAFIKPSANVTLEGELLKTYVTINGNNAVSNVDLNIDYDDFKVTVLQKYGREKNKLLSAVANLFVRKNSEHNGEAFSNGSKNTVQRDQTKSVFNFIWINISAALVDAML